MAENNIVNLVNELIKASFGKQFRGDLRFAVDFLQDRDIVTIEKELNAIGRKKWPFILGILERWEYAGRFLAEDGSSLEVMPDYVMAAERYVQFYKKRTGNVARWTPFDFSEKMS